MTVADLLAQPFTFLTGQAGCLHGDTTVGYNRGLRGGNRTIYLKDLFRRFNGLSSAYTWDLTLPTFLQSLGDDGVMFYNKIIAVYASGVKPLVRMELAGETFLRATVDHPILTPDGFVHAGDLKEGQHVVCRGTMLAQSNGGRDLSARPPRVIVNVSHHPFGARKDIAYRHVGGLSGSLTVYQYTRVARARLVVEAALNDLPYDEFVHALKHNAGLSATFRYIPTDFEVHHDDENTLNDELGNLVVLSKEEHARIHDQQGNFRFDSIREVPVVGVSTAEEAMTYDIQMESPANNFCANGIVVHNTGKTFLAREVVKTQGDKAILAAVTGIAAVNLGDATTINSLLSYFDTKSLMENYARGFLQFRLRMLRKSGVRLIVVDEISMMEADQLDILCTAIDEIDQTKEYDADLEQVTIEADDDRRLRLLLLADFAQLPPVEGAFAFEGGAWPRFQANTHTLRTIRRQGDRQFIDALQAVRRGHAAAALETLRPQMVDALDLQFAGTTIVAKNDAVDRINTLRYMKLAGLEFQHVTVRSGQQQKDWLRLIPEVLKLKPGALVMVLANKPHPQIDAQTLRTFQYVNGDLATVVGPHVDGVLVMLHRTFEEVVITPATKEWREPTGKRKPPYTVKGAVTYMPLRLAYATTVHKSQGLSLDAVQVSITDGFMSKPGMLYVALSRCRTLDGLRVVGTEKIFLGRCGVDPKIASWL